MSARFISTTVLFAGLFLAAPVSAQEANRPPAGNASALRQVTYPVAELVVPVEMDHTRPQSDRTLEVELMDLIKKTCAPRTWIDAGGVGAVQYYPQGMSLVVHQTPAVHAQIQRLLAELRRLQDVEISVES